MKGSTKPTGLLSVGSIACFQVAVHEGGWYWLFPLAFIIAVLFDAGRVVVHEEEHGCG